ncbi:flagellar basal body P-ring protein FlgI [Photobacterium rosenbergii]|uniref:Flagellar P-ring protein n=1 Tax=Photobacterium rosenbergii TaxID=294936 RepID=A0ABU3ZKX6_9GAMM|nr:flagellar basal body P-ring protein FlgI [Photobacterium rosenbergii]MDV5170778.1 flagellar basal body P-ring protein FlgI [Photobacterium rosenbergii]
MFKQLIIFLTVLAVPFIFVDTAHADNNERHLIDLVNIQGLRDNQLIGYGLVVGLDGTGDRNQVKFTSQSVTNMLRQFGLQLPENIDPKLRNVAAVSVHASIPPLAGPGQTIDVTVSSIGDAKSLRGGSLVMTPLRAIDGQIYAVAQGSLVVAGVKAEGRSGSSITVNVPTTGRIPGGAIIEEEIPSDFSMQPKVTLNLLRPNFTTARNISREIDEVFGPDTAIAVSNARVEVLAPKDFEQRVIFMSMLEDMTVDTGRQRARVVFNSRTGTVVVGNGVRIGRAAVSHGNLTVTIAESFNVSQPNAFGRGNTVVTPESDIDINHERNPMFIWPEGVELETIVSAVNSLGASPDDLIAILQALHTSGALDAELVVI